MSDLLNSDKIEYMSKEHERAPQTILQYSNQALYHLSVMELANIFSDLPASLITFDISYNELCRDNKRDVPYYLYQQENKLWAVCQFATNVPTLNIAGNMLHNLPSSSFQKLHGVFSGTVCLILGFYELKQMTMAQIKAMAEMFPNLEEVQWLDYSNRPVDKTELQSSLVKYFERCMPMKNKNDHAHSC